MRLNSVAIANRVVKLAGGSKHRESSRGNNITLEKSVRTKIPPYLEGLNPNDRLDNLTIHMIEGSEKKTTDDILSLHGNIPVEKISGAIIKGIKLWPDAYNEGCVRMQAETTSVLKERGR